MVSTSGNIHTPQNRNDLETLMKNPSEISKKTIDNIKAEIEQGSRVFSINKIVNRIAEQKFKEMNSEELTKGLNNLNTFIGAKVTYYDAESKNGIIKFGRWIAKIFSTNFGAIKKGRKMLENMSTYLNAANTRLQVEQTKQSLRQERSLRQEMGEYIKNQILDLSDDKETLILKKIEDVLVDKWKNMLLSMKFMISEPYYIANKKRIFTVDLKNISWNKDMCKELIHDLISGLSFGQTIKINTSETLFNNEQLTRIGKRVGYYTFKGTHNNSEYSEDGSSDFKVHDEPGKLVITGKDKSIKTYIYNEKSKKLEEDLPKKD